MTTVRHLMVPGLARRHLDTGWLRVTADDPPDRRSDLVATFPFSVATVEATLLTGRTPREHGRLFDDDPLAAPRVDAVGAVEHTVDLDLAHALTTADRRSDAERNALIALDERIVALRAAGGPLFVTGAPALGRVQGRVDLDVDGLVASGSMARLDHRPDGAERAALLATPGVERILTGDGLRSWHGPDLPAVLVAETGWAFDGGRAAFGRREVDDEGDTPVILAWGTSGRPWPAAVHDLRVAPTLARAAGIEDFETSDEGLPWERP